MSKNGNYSAKSYIEGNNISYNITDVLEDVAWIHNITLTIKSTRDIGFYGRVRVTYKVVGTEKDLHRFNKSIRNWVSDHTY